MKLDRWKGKRIVTTVSRLQKEKGQDILINSISDIRKQVPNVKLLVVGEGADRDRLERIVDEKDIRDFVEFLGFVDESEKFAILGLTDVFVFPTRWELEGFGLVSLEAMMMRTPVVATDFGPNREVLGESALLVEGSKNGLSNGISKLLEDSALRKAYERKGQKRVQELSISKTAQTYLDEFEKILKWKN